MKKVFVDRILKRVVIHVSFLLPTEVTLFFGLPKCKNFFEANICYSKGSADIQLLH